MPSAKTSNIGASVRQRLLNLAHASGRSMDLLLTRYVLERLLHRLSISPHGDRFVLKGAMLLTTWFDEPLRATRDLDLLGYGSPADDTLKATFGEVMRLEVDDGVAFDVNGLRVDPIRHDLRYGGSRLRTTAALAGARIAVTVDVGFGDAVEPGVEMIDLPVLLDMPSPHMAAYPPETVIAEKLHAMVILGMANTRMKDYHDVWRLLTTIRLQPDRLAQAIHATFVRRGTPAPARIPEGLHDAFFEDPTKQRQWRAFVRNVSGDAPDLATIVLGIRERLSTLYFERLAP